MLTITHGQLSAADVVLCYVIAEENVDMKQMTFVRVGSLFDTPECLQALYKFRGGIVEDPTAAWNRLREHQNLRVVKPLSLEEMQSQSVLSREAVTRFVCVSDTHGKHRQIPCIPGVFVLMCGHL